MREKKSRPQKYLLRKIFWSIIAAMAFLKAIEGRHHITKGHHKRKHRRNKIIYVYK